jgi:RimJ/RimL family protein N-acetyltransferase
VWTIRLGDTNELVGLITAQLTVGAVLHPDKGPREARIVESTIYVHPDYQDNGYGPEAAEATEVFVSTQFDLTQRKASIRWDNAHAQQLAAARSFIKQSEAMTQHGFQTWIMDQ